MNSVIIIMSIDKFGRYVNTSYAHLASSAKNNSYNLKLPFALTAENDINFLSKRLINIGIPRAASDCVTKEYVDQYYTGLLQQQQDDIRKIRDSISKVENETRELAKKINVLEEREEREDVKTSDITPPKHRFRI